jgi:hypothetical protein
LFDSRKDKRNGIRDENGIDVIVLVAGRTAVDVFQRMRAEG